MLEPSQVASRVLQILASKRHPIWTVLVSLVLVAVCGTLVVPAHGATALDLLLYGSSNGLRAIVRVLLPLVLMPPSEYVALMGKMSRPSLIAQAPTTIGQWVSVPTLRCPGCARRALRTGASQRRVGGASTSFDAT